MDLYEYQGKELFRRAGIPVGEGRLATTPGGGAAGGGGARRAGRRQGPGAHRRARQGRRGQARRRAPHEAEEHAKNIIGLDIKGHVVKRLWIEQASDIAKEYYLSLTFDRGAQKPLFMFTTQGGVEIEQVAEESPEALVRLHIDPLEGFHPWQARRLVYGAGVTDSSEQQQIARIVGQLYDAFVALRRHAVRDQPADRDAGGRRQGARLEVHRRRQRALPPSGDRRDARRGRRRPARGARPREARDLRQARRRGGRAAGTAPG